MKFPDLVARASRAVHRLITLFWLSPSTQNVGNLAVAAVAPATQSRRNNIQLDCYWLLEQRDPRAASDYTTEYTTRF